MLCHSKDSEDTGFELQVLHALSHARSNPKVVADALRNRLSDFKGQDYFPPDRGGKTAIVTKEGQVAVRDAISYLESVAPLPPLAADCMQGLCLGAEDHLLDLGQRGAVGHQGADGSISSDRMSRYGTWSGKCGECLWFGRMGTSATQIVEDLIIDDGVMSRGHRLGIYDPAFREAGVRMGPHSTFGGCCVMDFASHYQDCDSKLIARVTEGPPIVAAGRQPIKTQWSLGECPGCKETIHGGSVMEALGHKWHADCFACQAQGCGQKLRGVSYLEHGGMPFCKDCFYSHFGDTCAGCGEKITGGVMKALDQTWCKDCFVCCDCRGPLESRYASCDGKPLCSNCKSTRDQVPGRPGLPSVHSSPGAHKASPARRAMEGPPSKVGVPRAKSPPAARNGALPKIGAGRPTRAKAAPKSMGGAKRAMDALSMDYASLC